MSAEADRALSRHDLLDRLTEINFEPLVAGNFQTPRIEAKQLHDGGMDIGDIMWMFVGVETNLVRRAVRDASL